MSSQIANDFNQYGGSYLLSNDAYEDYVQGREFIGRPDGQFMAPSNQVVDLIKSHPNEPREWERQLGLKENSLGNENIHRVDVYNPHDYEPRLPTSDLSGSNEKFIDGGKTPGGQDECVINPFPNPENNPSVGQITNVSASQSINSSQNTSTQTSNSSITSENIASIGGGGANAPNITETDNKGKFTSDTVYGKVDTDKTGGFYDAKLPSDEKSPLNNSLNVSNNNLGM